MAELSLLKETRIDPTPTMCYNGLTVSPDGLPAYVFGEDIVIIRSLGPARITQSEAFKGAVSSLNFFVVNGRSVLGFTNRFGAFVFDVARDCAILRIPSEPDTSFRGIAVNEHNDNTVLAVGSESGAIHFHSLSADFEVVSVARSAASAPTSSLCSKLAAPAFLGTEVDGKVCIWNCDATLAAHTAFPGDTASCAIWNAGSVVVGFGSGTVRVLDESLVIKVAIGAHSRWITAMSSAKNGIIGTVAEDGLLCVWQISDEVRLIGHKRHADCLLTGCGFTGTAVTVVGYDSDKAWTYDIKA